jgi:hypothetical protein
MKHPFLDTFLEPFSILLAQSLLLLLLRLCTSGSSLLGRFLCMGVFRELVVSTENSHATTKRANYLRKLVETLASLFKISSYLMHTNTMLS